MSSADRRSPAGRPLRVVVAGGGFAALETVLALRALAGDRVEIELVAPRRDLRFRPACIGEAFAGADPLRYDLAGIAGDLGVRFHEDRLDAVDAARASVRLGSSARLGYDALVLAIGAAPRPAVTGALTFRDGRDAGGLRRVLHELAAGQLRHLVFAAPAGHAWTLPLYELALRGAEVARTAGALTDLAIVTPERAPMEVFGPCASAVVAARLAANDVHFTGATVPVGVCSGGGLEVRFGGVIRADRVVAVPRQTARRIAGVPARWGGFVPVDELGRVEGLRDVYAAGDMTTHPIKQATLACRQADAIASAIADAAGAPVRVRAVAQVAEARLEGGGPPLVLRAELDRLGRAAFSAGRADATPRPAVAKVHGRYLTPFLASRRPGARAA